MIDEKAYYASVRKHLLQNATCPNAIHDGILELDPSCIITTNYDTLLEEAALKNNQQFWVVSKDSDLPQNHGERLLVKMHGDMTNENIVLTENDYYDYSRNFPLIRSYVVSQFASKVVLFIGFSLSDINLKYAFPKDKRKGVCFEGRNLDLPEQYRNEFSSLFASRPAIIMLWRKYGCKLQELRNHLLDCDVSSIDNKSICNGRLERKRSKTTPQSAVQPYFQMDINGLVDRIKTLRGRSLAYTIEDLELPYALYLSGYYYDAYEIYSMLAPEMWKRRKYALFFICLYNKHSVARPAIRSIQGRKDMDCDEIKRSYYSSDLTKELNMLPLTECIHALFSDLIYKHQLYDSLIVTSNVTGKIAQQRKRAEERVLPMKRWTKASGSGRAGRSLFTIWNNWRHIWNA